MTTFDRVGISLAAVFREQAVRGRMNTA